MAVPSPPTNLILEQTDETSISVSWSPPDEPANITDYRVHWNSSECNTTPSTFKTLTGLVKGEHYSVSVASVSNSRPSERITRNIVLGQYIFCVLSVSPNYVSLFKVTLPGSINIDVTSVGHHGFFLSVNLSNYVENGKYHLIANATWLRFLHSCNNRLGDSNMTYETYTVNPMDSKITGLAPNSVYNITVTVTNAVGNETSTVIHMTEEAGMS